MKINPDSLRAIQLLKGVRQAELELIAKSLVLHEVTKNTVLMRQGETGKSLIMLAKGRVRVERQDNRGKVALLRQVGAGETFGEIALLTGSRRTATVVTTTRATAYELGYQQFVSIAQSHGGLILNLARILAERLDFASKRIEELQLLDVPDRLYAHLLTIAPHGGKGGHVVTLPTHRELAQIIGTSREVITRAFKTLQKRGLIAAAPQGISLLARAR